MRAGLTSAAAVLSKIVNLGTGLVTIPITLRYLGTERFGLWMTINSLVAIIAFADLGIGNGLLTAVSDAHGKTDLAAIRRYVASAFALMGFVAIALVALSLLLGAVVPWASIFNVRSELATREAPLAVTLFFVCFALNLPADIVQRVQLGLQQGFVNNLWQLGGNLAGFLGVLLVIHFRGGLPYLVAAFTGAPLIATILNAIAFFAVMRPDLRPSLRGVSVVLCRRIARSGSMFLLLQLAAALAFSCDNLIIAQVLGPEAVSRYVVAVKLFSVIWVINSMMVGPLWPAYGEAIARGDMQWVRRTLKHCAVASCILSSIGSIALIATAPWLVSRWLHQNFYLPPVLLCGLGLWTIIAATAEGFGMFLNGGNLIGIQVKLSLVFVPACLIAKFVSAKHFGIEAVPWSAALTYGICVAIPYALMLPQFIQACANRSLSPAPPMLLHALDLSEG